jgi:hypothetical protein
MRRAAFLLVCASLATLALIACGGGSGASPRVAADDPPCTNDATATAIIAARRSARTAEVSPPPGLPLVPDDEAHCRLRRALLTAADLPAGWSARDSKGLDRAYEDDYVGCNTPLPVPVAGLTVDFEREDAPEGEFQAILQRVYALQAGRGADVMSALKRACSMLASSAEGAEGSYELIEMPSLGDELIAVRDAFGIGDSLGDPEARNADSVYIRRGDVVSLLTFWTMGDLDLRRVAEIADAKLATTGPIPEPTPVTGQGCATSPTPESERVNEVSPGLLTLGDMPVGWVHDPPGPCGRIDGEGQCEDSGHPYSPPTPVVRASTGFSGYRNSYVGNAVGLYKTGQARAFMEGLRQRVGAPSQCYASMDGKWFEWRFDPLEAPGVGEDAIAWHVTTQGRDRNIDVYLLAIRRGRAVSVLSLSPVADLFHLGDDAAVREELATFAELADKKLQLIEGAAADSSAAVRARFSSCHQRGATPLLSVVCCLFLAATPPPPPAAHAAAASHRLPAPPPRREAPAPRRCPPPRPSRTPAGSPSSRDARDGRR